MVARITSIYDSFEFTPQEKEIAATFTDLNLLYLRNLRHEAVTAKLSLRYDPTQPHVFQQNEAMLTGKIDVLSFLIGD